MVPVQKSTNNPFWSPKGNLPVYRHNGIVLTDFPAVAKHLKSCNYSADYNLTNKQVGAWVWTVLVIFKRGMPDSQFHRSGFEGQNINQNQKCCSYKVTQIKIEN